MICLISTQSNALFHGQDAVHAMIKATKKSNQLEFPVLVPNFKPVLLQVTNALLRSEKYIEKLTAISV